jgi:uncharacterized protein
LPICDGAPLGAPCWIDLTSSDVKRAQEFYGAVFGWTFESQGPAVGGYITAAKDGRQIAGMLANVRQWPFPDGWSTYFHTADIDATISALTAAGATIRLGRMQLPARGVMAAVTDPSGAAFRLWQPLDAAGFEMVDEAGAPVWHQLITPDYRAAVDFYSKVFGWRTEQMADSGELRYTDVWVDDQQLLSIREADKRMPEGSLAQWSTYFGAEDLANALQAVTDHGGTVLQQPEENPRGRFAVATDPTGVTFNLSSLRS